jgi:CheY-like chemotaxis protein
MQKAESGLGLASSRRLAERMGGTMWVESSGVIGQVATFHFTVVVAEAEDQSFRDMLKEGLDCLRNKRALIVDENPARDRVITSQVAVWEMESVATTSITKAMLQLAEAPRFDIVIVDLPKSPTDRTSPAGKFLAMATAEDIPIVMLTSRLEISRHSGVAVQLVKPVSRQRLCNALCSLLASRAHRRAHPAWREQAESTPAPEPHLRILLADDSPVNQKIGQMMLAKLGCRADLACNGHEAMEAAIRIPYDVILMDCQMPQMNGYEATRRIRQMETSKHHSAAYIIAMTGMEGDRDKCLAAGMNDYLTKPVRPPELQEALDRFEAMQRPRESTAREPLLHV